MGWRDDPIAAPEPAAKGGWQNDPVVKDEPAAAAPAEGPGLASRALSGVTGALRGMLPPSHSPVGGILNIVTGGGYGEVAPAFGGIYQEHDKGTPVIGGNSISSSTFDPMPVMMSVGATGIKSPGGWEHGTVEGPVHMQEGPFGTRSGITPAALEEAGSGSGASAAQRLISGIKGGEDVPPVGGPPNVARRAVEAVAVTPTKAAEFLQREGLPITAGQMNPRSAIGQIEEASTSLRSVGPGIKAQRDAPFHGWQDLLLKEVLPPGMKSVPAGADAGEKLAGIYEGFRPAYASVKGHEIQPGITIAFNRAAKNLNVISDDATRNAVRGFLDNQLTIPKVNEAGLAPVEEVLTVRSNIRDAIRAADKANKPDVAAILRDAEQSVTKSVETQLPPDLAAKLKATDAQYRGYKVMERAVAAAGDSPSGFTPSQVDRAIRQSMSDGSFARGGGGRLRELAKAGRIVFESVTPPTGARLLTVGPMGEYATGPLSYYLNRPAGSVGLPPVQTLAPGLTNMSAAPTGPFGLQPANAFPGSGASGPQAPSTGAGATGEGAEGHPSSTPSKPNTQNVTGDGSDPVDHFKRWFSDPGYRRQGVA